MRFKKKMNTFGAEITKLGLLTKALYVNGALYMNLKKHYT